MILTQEKKRDQLEDEFQNSKAVVHIESMGTNKSVLNLFNDERWHTTEIK